MYTSLEYRGTPKHTSMGLRGICYHDFLTDNLPNFLCRIVVCYMWLCVVNRGLQCSGTWINYRWAAAGDGALKMGRGDGALEMGRDGASIRIRVRE